jgi:biotin operon repressor
MTQLELEALKMMSSRERIKRYQPMRLNGRITQQQYEYILLLGRDEVPRNVQPQMAPQPPDEGYARNDIRVGGGSVPQPDEKGTSSSAESGSQKEKLLALLKDKEWHTTVEIAEKVYCREQAGICRVGARIWDVKHAGYEIESRPHNGSKTVWEYRMK